jgi:acyl transferase domain-containing protein/acyl carrier protein
MTNNNDLPNGTLRLKRALLALEKMQGRLDALERARTEPIAVIGLGCRFPGRADTPESFWRLLRDGVDAVTEVPKERWDIEAYYDPDPETPGKMSVRHGAFLDGVDQFDPWFFEIPPREAIFMDPQQRLLLEVSWEALENAGVPADRLINTRTGVYVGLMNNDYSRFEVGSIDITNFDFYAEQASAGTLAGRVSYVLGLQGPSMVVTTACSSSLVTVHLACQALRAGECDLALAGGVNLILSPTAHIAFSKMRILASDGRCKAFDAAADGFGRGEGCGVVVLRRFSDALANGDAVLALVRGTAVNHNGPSGALTVPNGRAQARLIRQALTVAEIEPGDVGYVEAHGSGTSLGDPIEIQALGNVFQESHSKATPLLVGSVKSNLAHLEAAAGVAGLIKTVLALQHGAIPPHLHFREPNPHIPWKDIPAAIPTELTPWPKSRGKRVAGVSGFGMSGVNAHIILEAAPVSEPPPAKAGRPVHLLTLSAKTEAALDQMTENLAEHLRENPRDLADVAYTLQTGRSTFDCRRIVLCRDDGDAVAALEAHVPQCVLSHTVKQESRPITFMFPGLGDQYVNVAVELYQHEQVFRTWIDRCCELLQPHLGLDLQTILYTDSRGKEQGNDVCLSADVDLRQMLGRGRPQGDSGSAEDIGRTSLAQPLVFTIEYALAQLWMSWGIKPQAMIGYSLGEYVAACLAGVFSLEDGLRLVSRRARMIETLPAGAMMAVALPEDEAALYLDDVLSLSAVNGATMCVLAGPTEAIAGLERQLDAEEITCRQVQTTHAFHSKMIEPIAASLGDWIRTVDLRPPQIPYVSNVTGTWITAEQATDPDYWVTHLLQPVRFADGIEVLWRKPGNILLEVGIGQTLGSLALQHPAKGEASDPVVLSSLPSAHDRQSDIGLLLRSLGQLWLAGAPVDWAGFHAHQRRRCSLPTYPFERRRYWIDGAEASVPQGAGSGPFSANPESGHSRNQDIANWFYTPTWRRMPLLSTDDGKLGSAHWLLFVDDCRVGASLAKRLQQEGADVTTVTKGQAFQRVRDDAYTIDPQASADYAALIKHLHMVNKPPDQIVHLWSVTPGQNASLSEARIDEAQQSGFYSLLFLAQALGSRRATRSVDITVVSNNMQDVLGSENFYPEKATLLGMSKVIPREYAWITCSSVDIVLPAQIETLTEQLLAELLADGGAGRAEVVAYRERSRWVRSFEPVRLEGEEEGLVRLRSEGVYLITGGFGGLGFALAERLARAVQAKLILVGQTEIPPRSTWAALSTGDATDPKVRRRIQQVKQLESLGGKVHPVAADVADHSRMQQEMDAVCEKWGQIHGVFHLAGVPGGGLIQLKEPETVGRVLRPKLQGTAVLDAILQKNAPGLDFWVLYSSVNAVIGVLGEAGYCAANAFLDAFAHYSRTQRSISAVSINWGMWQWDAWQSSSSLAHSLPELYERVAQIRRTYGFTFDEGTKALWRVLSTSLPQVLVSTLDLESLFATWRSFASSIVETGHQPRKSSVGPRPNLRTPYVPPGSEVEEKIAGVWAESLGVEKVGIHDHFLELGGNSLLGMTIVSSLNKMFDVDLSATVLYEGPTVHELCKVIQPDPDEQDSPDTSSERGKRRRAAKRRSRRSVLSDN